MTRTRNGNETPIDPPAMQLTRETPRARWLVMLATWLGCAVLIVLHVFAVRDYMAFLDQLGRRGDEPPNTPLRQMVPARYSDAQMWVRHTLTARESDVARVRFTDTDNAPDGREVHWSSGFRWLVSAAGSVRQAWTGEPVAAALEGSLVWLNAPLLFALVVVISGWVARCAGAGAGVLIAAGMVGFPRFYENFAPMNADHHGLIAAALLGLQLGIVFMGAGWWQPPEGTRTPFLPASRASARHAAIFSAACGAVGMWISAASTIPGIALTGIAGLVVAWWGGPAARVAGAQFEPGVWRLWGRVGAALSFVFYLIEYAPAHLALRLEVNHPLYAAAWWGGAELIATLATWQRRRAESLAHVGWKLVLPVLAVFAPLVVIVAGGTSVFALRDPFIADLRQYVIEGQTFPTALRRLGFRPLAWDVALALLVVAGAVIAFRTRDTTRMLLAFLTLVTAAWAAMTFAEIRWMLTMSAAQITLIVFLLALAIRAGRRALRLTVIGGAAFVAVTVSVARVASEREKIARQFVADDDGVQVVYRDAALLLRASQPEGDIVLLASPNSSMGIGYFGRFKSLGTLFWENAAGLKAAASIFSARTDDEAAALIRARHVTHLAFISNALFLDEYFRLLHPDEPRANVQKTFGHRLFTQPLAAPRWLQPVPSRRRVEFEPLARTVLLFKVAFDQTEPERLYHTSLTQLARDELAAAEKTFELAFESTSPAQRPALCEAAGAAFYDHGADAVAVRLFRRALELGYDAGIASTVAWILASTANGSLRDGHAALALLEPQMRDPPADPMFLSAFAAASAEVGQFDNAINAAERAVALVRTTGDQVAAALLQKRLDAYRAGRAWRQ